MVQKFGAVRAHRRKSDGFYEVVISKTETSTFARQAAYTPPWEEIVPLYVYLPSRDKTNAHGGDKRVVFQNPHCRLIVDDSLFFRIQKADDNNFCVW